MLVSFELNNYLSYKDKAYLSMEKMGNKRKPYNYYNIHINNEKLQLLKSCFLFGGNSSGKTNLLSALMSFKHMVINGSQDSYISDIPYMPFEFSDEFRTSPITFAIEFIENNILYKYNISFNKNKILYEQLFYYKKEYNLILDRTINGFQKFPDGIYSDEEIKDNELSINSLQNKNWNHAVNVHKWFSKLTTLKELLDDSELFELLYDDDRKDFVIKILRAADFNIRDIRISKDKEYLKDEFLEQIRGQFPFIPKEILNNMKENKEIVTYHIDMIHDMSSNSNHGISLSMESSGTKIFFYIILQILFDSEQKVFLMDEFEESLSQDLVELIVDIINLSKNNSQYIFTTHNTSILKNKNLLNEQLYLIDKQQDGTSDIYSVEDFNEKLTKSQIYKHYISGELGGVPNVDKQHILNIIEEEINK